MSVLFHLHGTEPFQAITRHLKLSMDTPTTTCTEALIWVWVCVLHSAETLSDYHQAQTTSLRNTRTITSMKALVWVCVFFTFML